MRKWRKRNTLGALLPWEYEIGQNIDTNLNNNNDIKESSTNVCI